MKTSIPLALAGLSVLLLAISCNVESEGAQTATKAVLPPHFDPTHPPAEYPDSESLQAEKQERTAFDESLAGSGEAFDEPVPPELQLQLEADYQAALKRTDEQNGSPVAHDHGEVDFEALFEKIRDTRPPEREALLMQYVMAVRNVSNTTQQRRLLERLGSSELNNLR